MRSCKEQKTRAHHPEWVHMYKCIVQLVKDQALPYPACRQAVEALSNADIGWALEGKPWIMVASFSASEQGRAIHRLLSDASLSGLWSKGSDGSWPLVGFRVGQARTSRECQKVAEVYHQSVVRAPCEGEMSVSANDVED